MLFVHISIFVEIIENKVHIFRITQFFHRNLLLFAACLCIDRRFVKHFQNLVVGRFSVLKSCFFNKFVFDFGFDSSGREAYFRQSQQSVGFADVFIGFEHFSHIIVSLHQVAWRHPRFSIIGGIAQHHCFSQFPKRIGVKSIVIQIRVDFVALRQSVLVFACCQTFKIIAKILIHRAVLLIHQPGYGATYALSIGQSAVGESSGSVAQHIVCHVESGAGSISTFHFELRRVLTHPHVLHSGEQHVVERKLVFDLLVDHPGGFFQHGGTFVEIHGISCYGSQSFFFYGCEFGTCALCAMNQGFDCRSICISPKLRIDCKSAHRQPCQKHKRYYFNNGFYQFIHSDFLLRFNIRMGKWKWCPKIFLKANRIQFSRLRYSVSELSPRIL